MEATVLKISIHDPNHYDCPGCLACYDDVPLNELTDKELKDCLRYPGKYQNELEQEWNRRHPTAESLYCEQD
jgi:hypothetical protein